MSGVKDMGWSVYKRKRGEVIRFLTSEYNRLSHEAFFDEDFKKAEQYKKCIDFMYSMDGDKFFHHKNCPICGSPDWLYADFPKTTFVQKGGKHRKTKKPFRIRLCKDCDFYCIVGW